MKLELNKKINKISNPKLQNPNENKIQWVGNRIGFQLQTKKKIEIQKKYKSETEKKTYSRKRN